MLIDTHCHLNHERLAGDIEDCLQRAFEADVQKVIVVGCDRVGSETAVKLAERYPAQVFAAVGVHPHDSKHWDNSMGDWIRDIAQNPAVVAIGETGLDFHYDFSPRIDQYAAFRAQMRLAKEVSLPIILHCREAYPETLEILAEPEFADVRGVMHCWAGSVAQAKQTVALGYWLGIGGTLTFKNAEEIRAGTLAVPLTSLLVETDAPFLAPMPYRGKRNEPAYTRLVAEHLAELHSLSYPELAEITTQNARDCFPKLV
ncbi:MAG: TatD family hydrolase [Armatimonadetes bacterium]|nr:TatD family hydrolase [Armatimonadota bacterium]